MAVTKLLNLLAISCLAIIASFGPVPVSALSVESVHHARRDHHVLAAKKRGNSSKRCKPRSTTPAPSPSPTTSKKPAPKPTSSKDVAPPSSTPPSSGGDSGARKVGIAFTGGDESAITQFWSWKTQFYYTWSPWCIDAADQVGFQCCRMLWGFKQIDDFTKNARPGHGNCAMGPNEPNEPSQSNMSPQDAAGLWKQYLEPLHDNGYTLISPACTNAPSGKTWMQDFFKACDGCHVDRLAVHFYGTDAQDLIDYVEDMHATFGKQVWVTEFACQDFSGGQQSNQQQVTEFMQKVTAYMDHTDKVGQYFAFGALTNMGNVNPKNQLLNPSGNGLTSLGKLYIGE
ncbi:hypothetical protein AGABI1DRAFT_113420 [Agaricus bisporus var. burnettii JB137-S8]|uniref:Asl1-like glycosyl hydrolase catalytic domain-containing protein n=1 Tax=Agaricus bisporus var. burnettii (strain JB137-S8 / ATCC MYA-4627 / FGSC 10392) TaxID=597362 RepID=K5XAF5_AGABU|nr:uncharacterized protein AGABI1DRAFT_113420 [Agaricus bisporus var. burnettii JB137-S8]EKM80218.1 hypothetical protein AGABI1DRAFT_113420 [Agaricus bisporus var. burnettii JB137-S8]